MKTAKTYFSPLLPHSTIPSIIGIRKLNEPFASIRPISGDDFYETVSVSTPKVVEIQKQDEPYDSAKYYLLDNKQTEWLSVEVDTSQEVDIAEGFFKSEAYKQYRSAPSKFALISDKARRSVIINDKDSDYTFKGYPVYITNLTAKPKLLYVYSYAVEITQEAKDKKGKWRPIELPRYFLCGMGFHWRPLQPNEQIATRIFKYKGDFKTLLRLKLSSKGETAYSQPFSGSINYSQFDISKIQFIDAIPYEKKNSR